MILIQISIFSFEGNKFPFFRLLLVFVSIVFKGLKKATNLKLNYIFF